MEVAWQYYDLVLLGVVGAMVIGGGVGYLTSVSLPTAVAGGSLVAAAIVGHGVFVNGPDDRPGDASE